MKKVIIIILAILLAVFIGIILPILINNGALGSEGEDDLKGEEDIVELGLDDIPGGASGVHKSTEFETDASEETSVSKSEDDPTPKTTPINASENDNEAYDEGKNGSDEQNEILSESWVEEMIREYGHHISEYDMDYLRRLYSQVDILYLQCIMVDGYTDEEVEEVKAYLKDTLGSDYQRGKELFYKYSYLMNEIEI